MGNRATMAITSARSRWSRLERAGRGAVPEPSSLALFGTDSPGWPRGLFGAAGAPRNKPVSEEIIPCERMAGAPVSDNPLGSRLDVVGFF